ncbi:MAG: hypothetical protein JSR53_19125 [Proteobacteria bacterium]|nr:hypothetical protein [Pseudomonadota bacterium]
MVSARQLAQGDAALLAAVERSQRLLHRRALVAGVAGAMPVPGLDWAVDAALLSRLIPAINQHFGLTPGQIDRLDPSDRDRLQKAIAQVGTLLVGKFITQDLLLRSTRLMGLRLSTAQVARYVPLVGQAASAAIGYGAIRFLGQQHIRDCVRVVRQAGLALPPPAR